MFSCRYFIVDIFNIVLTIQILFKDSLLVFFGAFIFKIV